MFSNKCHFLVSAGVFAPSLATRAQCFRDHDRSAIVRQPLMSLHQLSATDAPSCVFVSAVAARRVAMSVCHNVGLFLVSAKTAQFITSLVD